MTENILKVLEFTADKAQAIAGAQSVVGEPIVIGDVTVVPISAVDCGFAGGGSDLPAKQKNDALLGGAAPAVPGVILFWTTVPAPFANLPRNPARWSRSRGRTGCRGRPTC